MYTIGDYVKIVDSNIEGTITNIQNEKVTIFSKDKYVKTTVSKIQKSNNKPISIMPTVKVSLTTYSKPEDEIMIRHQTVQEAIENVDKFIDNAICNNLKIVKIIHGKKGGILRKEVHKYLENNPNVKEHRLGGYYEGSYGVTIVFLK